MQIYGLKFKKYLFFNYLVLIILVFGVASFISNSGLIDKSVLASSATNFQISIYYAKEVHQIDTTQSFIETLLNPNESSFDIELPADALTSGEIVNLTMYSTPEETVTNNRLLPDGKSGADVFYNISFEKNSDGSPVSVFNKPIDMVFNYIDDDIDGINESTLAIYRWHDSEWVILNDSEVDTNLNKITATSQHFSFFGLLGDTLPSCGNNVKETGEQCDGFDLAEETCISLGFTGGVLNCNANCTLNTSVCTSGGGGGGGGSSYVPPQTTISFSGRAYPLTTITLLKDAQIVAMTVAGPDAKFQITLTSLLAGNYIFSLYSQDKEGQRSSLQTLPISITDGVTIDIGGIFIAPTINVDKSEIRWGGNLTIFGQSITQSEVTIIVNSKQDFFIKTQTDKDGVYLYNFDTTQLEVGQHFTKSKVSFAEEISPFSKSIGFIVGSKTVLKKISGEFKGDLNNDNRINLVDFSVAAYWYKKSSPPPSIDLNNDGKIDLVDFSIMAFYWTG